MLNWLDSPKRVCFLYSKLNFGILTVLGLQPAGVLTTVGPLWPPLLFEFRVVALELLLDPPLLGRQLVLAHPGQSSVRRTA